MNTVTASFNTNSVRQMTKMSQQQMTEMFQWKIPTVKYKHFS